MNVENLVFYLYSYCYYAITLTCFYLQILILLCLSGVYSETLLKKLTDKEPGSEKSKRYATHSTPCPPELSHESLVFLNLHSQPSYPINKVS